MAPFTPTPFADPVISPETTTFFRQAPYLSPSEYRSAPTAVATDKLIPAGTAQENLVALAQVINRASDWLDLIVFHSSQGTLAASPTTEASWVKFKGNGLAIICNQKPILQVSALALGAPGNMEDIGSPAAEVITIDGSIIHLPGFFGPSPRAWFPAGPRGKVYAIWNYVAGYPHTYLTVAAEAKEEFIKVAPSTPGTSEVSGVYPGTQLTIHDGEFTEVVVVKAINGLELELTNELLYDHTPPTLPDTTRVSAIPWAVEQACIYLTSSLIKSRGSRAMVIPQSPGKATAPPVQAEGQAGGTADFNTAVKMLKPFIVPVLRST